MPPSQPPPSRRPPSHRAAVLVTRPQPAADRLAGRLREEGLAVQVAPLMRIVPVAHDAAALARAPGLVFTSAHAVAMAGPGLDRPAMCVGPATADAARAAGFRVTVGPGDAAGLLRNADLAMYRAKARGRDRSELFDEEMRAEAMRLLDLEADLRRAYGERIVLVEEAIKTSHMGVANLRASLLSLLRFLSFRGQISKFLRHTVLDSITRTIGFHLQFIFRSFF